MGQEELHDLRARARLDLRSRPPPCFRRDRLVDPLCVSETALPRVSVGDVGRDWKDARLRTPRYLLHLFDPLRIFGKPRFEEAQEFLFLTRYFRWQHREAIAHAFGGHEGGHSAGGGHGDEHDGEDDSGWKGGRSSVLHTSGKKSGFGKLAAQAAATSSGVSSGLGEHSTSQLNVAELLAITINHHLGEHLEVSPLMWVCFCLLLGVYITIKEIDYAVQKKAGTFGHAGEMVTYETKYNELRAR